MTTRPTKFALAPGLGLCVALAIGASASAVVVDPEPPEIVSQDFTCSDDVVPGTGSASITIINPVDSNGETRTYAWSLTGPSGSFTGGVTLADGAQDTVVVNGLSAGTYDFETFDAALPALSASTSVVVPSCPPPPSTTTTTTTTTTSTTTTSTTTIPDSTTIPGATTIPGTTIVGATTPQTPPPTPPPAATDPAPPAVLPATGSDVGVGVALLGGLAVVVGSLMLALIRRTATAARRAG